MLKSHVPHWPRFKEGRRDCFVGYLDMTFTIMFMVAYDAISVEKRLKKE